MMNLTQIDHVAITTADFEKSVNWYCEVLGGKRIFTDAWDGEPAFIEIGSSSIAIFSCNSNDKTEASHHKINILHIAFKADKNNFEAAKEHLKKWDIKFRFEDHNICHSIYFRDPDHHLIEITTYELT